MSEIEWALSRAWSPSSATVAGTVLGLSVAAAGEIVWPEDFPDDWLGV